MSSTRRSMTRREYTRLQNDLAALRADRRVEVRGDSGGDAANRRARRSVRQMRIRDFQDRLTSAIVDGDPVDDPIARAGMVLTIRHDRTGDIETFLLGRRDAHGAGMKTYSMASPLGGVIAGARPGDQRIYSIPNETGQPVTLLEAVPYEMHVAEDLRAQSAGRR